MLFLAVREAGRRLVCLAWLVGAFGAANAQPSSAAKIAVMPATVALAGEISIQQLSKRAVTPQEVRPPVEKPKRRRPDGTLTSEPLKGQTFASMLKASPSLRTNANVTRALPPGRATVRGFVGIHSYDNVRANGYEVEPPGQGLAVFNGIAAEATNDVVQFFNARTGVPLTPPIPLSWFFLSDMSVGDPQVFFDLSTQRWFFIETISNFGGIQQFGVAVSANANPLGAYFVYHVSAYSSDLAGCGGTNCFPGFAKAGYNANGLFISANLIGGGGKGAFVAAATYVLPKARLMIGAPFVPVRVVYPGDFLVQPSAPAPGEPFVKTAYGTEFLMEARNISTGLSIVRVWAISNTAFIDSNPLLLRVAFTDVVVQPYGPTVPAAEPNVVGPFCWSRGFDTPPLLDGGYNAFQSTIVKASGRLHGALPFGALDGAGLPRDVLAWFSIKATVNKFGIPTASVFAQGYVVPPAGYSLLNPAFALRKTTAGILGFSIVNRSQFVPGGFPSTGFVAFTGTGLGGAIVVTGQGIASDDGFTGCVPVPGASRIGRWGDYGAAAFDPMTGLFYAANENISGKRGEATNWGTFITQVGP